MQTRTVLGVMVSVFYFMSAVDGRGAESSLSAVVPTLEILSINPPSPAVLEAGQKVTVKVRYDMAGCESVQIWVRSSSASRGEISHPCSPIPRTQGQSGIFEGWLYFDDKAQVKEIAVRMKDVAKNAFVYEMTKAVDYRWTNAPAPKAPEKFEGITRIPGSFTWDVDSDTIGGNSKLVDLWFQVDRSNEQVLVTRNNAGMAIFDLPFDQLQLEQLRRCSFGQKSRSSLNERYPLKPGFCFGLKTSEGRIAKLELLEDEFPQCLVFRWQLYPDAVKRETESRNSSKTDSAKQYGGLWYYVDPWGRPEDRIVVVEGRFEQGGKLAFDLVKHFCVSKPVFTDAVIQKDQIEIRFSGIEYAGQNSSAKTMTYSLLYHQDQLLGQVFRDGLEPEKVVMRRPDVTMANQIITCLARESRDMQARLEREQARSDGEKLALKNKIQSLGASNGQLQEEMSGLRELLDRSRKEIEDMRASWDRAKEQISRIKREMTEIQKTNQELVEQKKKDQQTVRSLENMLRQADIKSP
ncbi:MAG: hypothetical protein GX455_02470 [Phycisphaerae bacterium]|nr:hypothetical protein [Phycisphaerae bacterium]